MFCRSWHLFWFYVEYYLLNKVLSHDINAAWVKRNIRFLSLQIYLRCFWISTLALNFQWRRLHASIFRCLWKIIIKKHFLCLENAPIVNISRSSSTHNKISYQSSCEDRPMDPNKDHWWGWWLGLGFPSLSIWFLLL